MAQLSGISTLRNLARPLASASACQKRTIATSCVLLQHSQSPTTSELHASIRSAQGRITEGFTKLESTVAVLALIKTHESHINENGSFTYFAFEEQCDRKPFHETVQLCSVCNVTSCSCCEWPDWATKSQCLHSNGGQKCPYCPRMWPNTAVDQSNEVVSKTTVKVQKEWSREKTFGLEDEDGLPAAQQFLIEKEGEMDGIAKAILADMQVVKDSQTKLDQFAKKPRTFTDEDYLAQTIKLEEELRNPGYKARVKGLEFMRTRARASNGGSSKANMEDLFPSYKAFMNETLQRMDKSACTQKQKQTGENCAIM